MPSLAAALPVWGPAVRPSAFGFRVSGSTLVAHVWVALAKLVTAVILELTKQQVGSEWVAEQKGSR